MPVLDLYKERKHTTIKLADSKEYKIPNEYTVAEAERLLELREQQEALEKEEVEDQPTQLKKFWALVFDQLSILFQHYQPEVTAEYLKKHITQNEGLAMLGFFQKYRHLALKEMREETDQDNTDPKKKSRSAKLELRDLRRMIAFMVVNGFSLFDLRGLYIDELYSFYEQLFYTLEKTGTLKEGSYDKLMKRNKGTGAESTVNQLRRQMIIGISGKNKKS